MGGGVLANYAQATILSLDNVLKPLNITDTIEFDIPYFNNVRILSTEFVGSKLKSPMFGDEMDFRLWKKLKLTFGFRNGNYTIYTLTSGWKYIYVPHSATFDIYDDTGANVYHADNVKAVADFHVDFTVVKSHQFEVHFYIEELFPYFLPAIAVKKKFGESPILNINKDRFNSNFGYSRSDGCAFSKRITDNYLSKFSLDEHRKRKFYNYYPITSVNHFNLDWQSQIPCSHVYGDDFKINNVKHKPQKFKVIKLQYKMLFSVLLMSLIPSLQPIERPYESHNNRPVYEPWLIWGFFKFLWLHRITDDIDDYPIDVWDLSPNWSY